MKHLLPEPLGAEETSLEQLVLRKAQREQKSLVDQKGKSFLDFGFQ